MCCILLFSSHPCKEIQSRYGNDVKIHCWGTVRKDRHKESETCAQKEKACPKKEKGPVLAVVANKEEVVAETGDCLQLLFEDS